APDAGVLFAERQQHHGGLLRPAQARSVDDALGFTAADAHAVSCSQLRMIETDSSGCLSTNSATRLTELAFTWPSMRAMSIFCSICSLPGAGSAICSPVAGSTASCMGWPSGPAAIRPPPGP